MFGRLVKWWQARRKCSAPCAEAVEHVRNAEARSDGLRDALGKEIAGFEEISERLWKLEAERDAWRADAQRYAQSAEFYRDLVRRLGDMLGPETRRADDGRLAEDVLALRVPEVLASVLHTLKTVKYERDQLDDEVLDVKSRLLSALTAQHDLEAQVNHAFGWIKYVCEIRHVAVGGKPGEAACYACCDHRKCPVYRAHQSFEDERNSSAQPNTSTTAAEAAQKEAKRQRCEIATEDACSGWPLATLLEPRSSSVSVTHSRGSRA